MIGLLVRLVMLARGLYPLAQSFAIWLLLIFAKYPLVKFGLVVTIMLGVVAAIPWPAWIGSISGLFTALPPGVVWGLTLVRFSEGLAILASAWTLRFMLRWIRAAVSAS